MDTKTETDKLVGSGACSALEVQVIVKQAGPMIHGVAIRASDGLVLRQWTSSDEGWLKHDLFSGPLAVAFWRETAPQGYVVISWNDEPNIAVKAPVALDVVREYDPRKPDMHSIFRAEDDPRTLSPEMDEWNRKQIAKHIRCTCADKTNQVCDICQGQTANDALPKA